MRPRALKKEMRAFQKFNNKLSLASVANLDLESIVSFCGVLLLLLALILLTFFIDPILFVMFLRILEITDQQLKTLQKVRKRPKLS